MSKYVNKKHGLIIGSDNIFFIVNDTDSPEGIAPFRDGYRAVVWAQSYGFHLINTVNVFIQTPAQQLLYGQVKREEEQRYGIGKFTKTYYVLSNYARRWLEKNVGPQYDKWDIRTLNESIDTASIFFKRRKDALKLTKMVEEMLSGADRYGY